MRNENFIVWFCFFVGFVVLAVSLYSTRAELAGLRQVTALQTEALKNSLEITNRIHNATIIQSVAHKRDIAKDKR